MAVDTLGLVEECLHLIRELGYEIREEPLGDLPGGACTLAGRRVMLLNLEHGPTDRLEQLLRLLAATPDARALPMSRLLASRLAAVAES